jgi:hypothetical protein
MQTIEQTLEAAEKAGLKEALLEWVSDTKNHTWDVSLYNDTPAFYDMGLKILQSSIKQKEAESFLNGFWNTAGHPKVPTTGIMEELLSNYGTTKSTLETESYSQINQDIFVINLLNQKKQGLFLDIGAGCPKFINNTYLLERKYQWSGVSIELDYRNKVAWEHSDRDSSNFVYENAFDVDYDKVISNLLNKHNADRIDYLSVDLEPPHLTLEVLYKIITSTKHRFSIITFEHDLWRDGEYILKASRELLKSRGYRLVVDNINNQEDWYVDATY